MNKHKKLTDFRKYNTMAKCQTTYAEPLAQDEQDELYRRKNAFGYRLILRLRLGVGLKWRDQ